MRLWLGHRASFALFGDDELQEAQRFGCAGIPMRMRGSRWHKKAVAGVQRDRRLSFFLPNASPRQYAKGNRCRMEMTWIDPARSIICIPDDYFLICGSR